MRVFRASGILDGFWPEGLEHLVRAPTKQNRVGIRHLVEIELRECGVRHDPLECSLFGRKKAVSAEMIERNDSPHIPSEEVLRAILSARFLQHSARSCYFLGPQPRCSRSAPHRKGGMSAMRNNFNPAVNAMIGARQDHLLSARLR
jgi:hypothetical protein